MKDGRYIRTNMVPLLNIMPLFKTGICHYCFADLYNSLLMVLGHNKPHLAALEKRKSDFLRYVYRDPMRVNCASHQALLKEK